MVRSARVIAWPDPSKNLAVTAVCWTRQRIVATRVASVEWRLVVVVVVIVFVIVVIVVVVIVVVDCIPTID